MADDFDYGYEDEEDNPRHKRNNWFVNCGCDIRGDSVKLCDGHFFHMTQIWGDLQNKTRLDNENNKSGRNKKTCRK